MQPRATASYARGAFVFDIIVDHADVDRLLLEMNWNVSDARLAFFMESTVEPWIQYRTMRRFATEGDEVSGPWAPLKPSTQAIRASAGYPRDHPINVRTTEFREWLRTDEGQIDVTGAFVQYTYPRKPADPTLEEKLQTAQAGRTFPVTVPRPVIGLGPLDLMFINNELTRHLLGAFAP